MAARIGERLIYTGYLRRALPEPRADRVVLEIVVDRVLCSAGLRE